MAKLSKNDQITIKIVNQHLAAGNKAAALRVMTAAVRSANSRSEPLLRAELAKLI